MAPARDKTQRDHAVYDRRSRPRGPASPAPTSDVRREGIPWKRVTVLVVVVAAAVALLFAARSLAHWPDAFF